MRLLKKTDSGTDIKGNIAPDKFHLHLHGMIMSAVKNGYFLQRHTAANQFRNPLRHKIRLFQHVLSGNHNRPHAIGAHCS